MKSTCCISLATSLLAIAVALPALAGNPDLEESSYAVFGVEPGPESHFLFEGGELFLDLYGASTRELIDETGGLGLGAGYYFTRNWGFIFNATWVRDETEFRELESGRKVVKPGHSDSNIFLGGLWRLPVDEAGIAFYGVGGVGGYVGDDSIRTWEIGGGIEARLTYQISGLLEARYIEPESSYDLGSETLFKIGLRYIF